jgi:hypothetical protein
MFDRAWIENELAGLIVQKHQVDGAISVLQQMLTLLDAAEQAAVTDLITRTDRPFVPRALPEGAQMIGVETHEHPIHP